jgi:hypothetical protein
MGSPVFVMLLPRSRISVRSTIGHAAGQSQGDHFEGHFEGQNGVSERQSESDSARVSYCLHSWRSVWCRPWTCRWFMACKRSAVRARLAPPRSDTEIRTLNRRAFVPEGHSEGQDPPEAGRLTSDDAEIAAQLRASRAFATFKRSPVAAKRASERTELAAGCGTLISAWCHRGNGGGRLERGPRSYGDLGLRDRLDEPPSARGCVLSQVASAGVARTAANIRFCCGEGG